MWEFRATKADRLDRLLRDHSPSAWLSRQAWEQLLLERRVRVDGQIRKKAGESVGVGALVQVDLPPLGLTPAERPARLLLALPERSIAFFSKDVGMPTYPLLPWETGTLANGIARWAEESGWLSAEGYAALADPPLLEGGLVQRLDTDTSGIVTSAFTAEAKAWGRKVFSGQTKKVYLAIVAPGGGWRPGRASLFFSPGGGRKVAAAKVERVGDVPVELSVDLLERAGDFALVRVETTQGLRHVVRAGMAALGCPLVGDELYGGTMVAPHHQLHALSLSLPGLPVVKDSPPESFLDCLGSLGLHWSE